MSTSDRSQAIRGTTVALKIQYYDSDGNAADADSTPKIEINDSLGETQLEST